MRSLKEFKMPKIKFPKIDFKGIENLEELSIDYTKVQNVKKDDKFKPYPRTNYKTVKEIFEKTIKEYGDKEFLLEKPEHKKPYDSITYKKFGEDVKGLEVGLNKFISLKGKRVAIISETTYYWYVSYTAILCSEAIAVPLDKELPANEIENLINRSRAEVIIFSPKKKEIIDKIRKNVPTLKFYIQMNMDYGFEGQDVGIKYIINAGNKIIEDGKDDFDKIKIDPEEFKQLIFTSGTTSAAKGVMISNRNLAENINAVSAYVKLNSNDRFFSVLPLHHTYESTIGFILPMAVGASIVVCEGLKHIVPNLQETKPTAMLAVPLLVESLYKKINDSIKKSKKEALVGTMIQMTNALKAVNIDVKRKVFKEIHANLGGNIRIIVSAAAPIDKKVGKWLNDIGIGFIQGYGLTETAPISALTPELRPTIGSVGKAVDCAEIKIDDPNEKGEGDVLIKSTTLMLGYYENEEETKKVIKNGWFNSGDVGYLDDEGFLYITGRSKNVIVTQNGKNIYPEEIELTLGYVPEIKECMVYGKEVEGEKELIISAKVIPNIEYIEEVYGKNKTDEEIHDIIWEKIKENNKKSTSYKAIKNLEIKKDEFEKTTTMKIKRFVEIQKDKLKK